MGVMVNDTQKKSSLDDALEATGFGKYNIMLLISCCCLILAMVIDVFSFSILMPAVACDLALTAAHQGLLSATPLIGVMISSYVWGLCADTLGRRTTLTVAMPIGMALNLAASLAPNYWCLVVVKFLCGCFTSSANAAAFVLVGECVPQRYRSRSMYVMVAITMMNQLIMSLFAIPVFSLSFRIDLWLGMQYRPWRLLMQLILLPGVVGCILLILFTKESPKFLLCKNRHDETMHVLQIMYAQNTGKRQNTYPISGVYLNDVMVNENTDVFILRKMWNQTAPLFKPPLLKSSMMLYYLLLSAYMSSTGFTMWIPTFTNAYFKGDDSSGKTLCQVASKSAWIKHHNLTVLNDCDNTMDVNTLYITMVYSISGALLCVVMAIIVVPLGKKKSTIMVFAISFACGVILLFVKIPILSIIMFSVFSYSALIYGNINTYLVELNPTYLRGMATCLSVVVVRGLGFISVQIIAVTVSDYCVPMMSCYVALLGSGIVVSLFLPADKKTDMNTKTVVTDVVKNNDTQVETSVTREESKL